MNPSVGADFSASIDHLDLLMADIRARFAEQDAGLIQPAITRFLEYLLLMEKNHRKCVRYSFGKSICISQLDVRYVLV